MKLPQSFRYEKTAIREAIRMWKYLKNNPTHYADRYFLLFENKIKWYADCACCHYYGRDCMIVEDQPFIGDKIIAVCPLSKDKLCENLVNNRTAFGNWFRGRGREQNATIIYDALVKYYQSKWKDDVDKIEYPTPVK